VTHVTGAFGGCGGSRFNSPVTSITLPRRRLCDKPFEGNGAAAITQVSQQEKKMTEVIAADDRADLNDNELALVTGGARPSGGGSGGSSGGGGIEGYSKVPLIVVPSNPPDLFPLL
jgi:hypothetical protein